MAKRICFIILLILTLSFYKIHFSQITYAQELPPLPPDSTNLLDNSQSLDIGIGDNSPATSDNSSSTTSGTNTGSSSQATTTSPMSDQASSTSKQTTNISGTSSLSKTGQDSLVIGSLAAFFALFLVVFIVKRNKWNAKL